MSSVEPTAQTAVDNGELELARIDRIVRMQILPSERDALDLCRPKVRALVDALKQAIAGAGDLQAPGKVFSTWKATPVGEAAWEEFKKVKLKYPDPAAARPAAPPATPVVWSDTCNTVWTDMHTRFDNWRKGTATNRGHWWGGPANGGLGTGVGSVPDTVVEELRKRILERPGNVNRESWWRFAASDSGGLAFHRSSGGVDFIYHLSV